MTDYREELAGGANAGEGSRMSRDYNKWTDTDGTEHEPEQNGDTHEYFSADFSDVGERVSEIIGDAYRQIHRAVNQAGAAVDAAIKQSAENAERANSRSTPTRQPPPPNARGRRWNAALVRYAIP